jgi:hypothetical protein
VGILYEVWHSAAAAAMGQVTARNLTQLTVESVIRSANESCLDDVYPSAHGPWHSGDIWNVKPAGLGFYCLYRARDKAACNATVPPTPYFPPEVPDCPMASAVAARHASMLSGAGVDYIAVDITNWPQVNSATDLAVLRPMEVLMEEWLALRAQGKRTPQLVAWCDSPHAFYPDGHQTTWQWLLDHVYNNATRAPLLWRRPSQSLDAQSKPKMTFFVPDNGHMNTSVNALIAANVGGASGEIDVVSMWAMMGGDHHDPGMWAFFSTCRVPSGEGTTSMIGGGAPGFGDCNQSGTLPGEVSASGAYMLAQCAIPWGSPGKLRGLTLQRLFKKVLAVGAPDLFLSSFNEHIGGRQKPSQAASVAGNMGLPYDSQRTEVWVDTYGSEFSRDLEPSEEGGSRVWEVAQSCIALYRQGISSCDAADGAQDTPCCTTSDKQVWQNVWSVGEGASGPPPPPPPPPLHCPPGYVLDVVDAAGDNGSCKCETFCASNWADSVKSQRPHWRGATAAVKGTTTGCKCIQASHWCTATPGKVGCSASCDQAGEPVPQDYCVKAPADVPPDRVATSIRATRDSLVAGGWRELCAATNGASVFCYDGANPDGRDGPFMVYSAASAIEGGGARELHRCRHALSTRFLSTDATCEGMGTSEELIGWVAQRPGGETLRALHRCLVPGAPVNSSARTHALDLPCDIPDGGVLGYVR